MINESNDSININKYDILDSHIGKPTLTGLDISSLNVSIMNSAQKNPSKNGKTMHKGRENNMSIDSSRCVKATLGKDKHLYSIVPFEYKIKTQNITSPSKSEVVLENTEAKENENRVQKEIQIEEKKENNGYSDKNEGEIEEDVNISNNSIQIIKEEITEYKNVNKEIVFELHKGGETDFQNPLITPRNKIEIQEKTEHSQNSSFDSPNEIESENEKEDWDLKLPSIKSSSGHENLRNFQTEEVKDIQNESQSIGLLDKSAEVEMFISPKDLSPKNSGKNIEISHLRTRINSLRTPNEAKNLEENNELHSGRNSTREKSNFDQVEVKEDHLNSSSREQNNQQLLQKFKLMKEPGMSAREALHQNLMTQNIVKKKSPIEIKQQENSAEMISTCLYDFICQEVIQNMFTPRVNVESLRNNYKSETEHLEIEKSESIEESSEENNSDSESENYSALKLQTDSSHVMDYVNQIFGEIQMNHMADMSRKLAKPIRMNELILLRDLQSAEYDVERTQEFETESIVNIELYLQKERKNKVEKEEKFNEQIARIEQNDSQNNEALFNTL